MFVKENPDRKKKKKNSNQRLENWWSHFRRKFSGWAIDHFKELVDEGKFIPDNMFRMKCIWFVYAQFIQTRLDEVKQEWNYHKNKIFERLSSFWNSESIISFT